MITAPPRAIALFGTDEPVAASKTLRAGPLTVEFDNGALRYIKVGGVEAIRNIAFVVRDKDWGTYNPVLENLKIDHLGRAKKIQVSLLPVLMRIDQFLRMLDPQPELKGLGTERQLQIVQHLVCVTCAVTDREDDHRRRNQTGRCPKTTECTVTEIETFQSASKSILPSECFNLSPKVATDQRQLVAAQVSPVFIDE